MSHPIYQSKMLDFLNRFPNTGVMIPVHGHTKQFDTDAFFQSRLFPLDEAEENMKTDDTNHWGSSYPGFTQYGSGENAEVVYSRFDVESKKEPFVITREYNGLYPDEVEICEEFRLLNNLFFDRTKNQYIDPENEVVVAQVEGDLVSVHKKYLKRYLSVKNMVMIVHVDSRYFLDAADPSLTPGSHTEQNEEKLYTFQLGVLRTVRERSYSMIYAKTVIRGVPLSECGYWPFNEADKRYEEFIIGVDEDGNETAFTCNPDKLDNYFGKNPEAPHYLTPVFFNREVLKRYYDRPDRYTISEGIIRCGIWWSLYIDNVRSDYVSAYLGDLGRYLPDYKEQQYWKTHNIVIDGELSESKIARDFHGQWTSGSESPLFSFQTKYQALNKKFNDNIGWSLFLPLDDDDRYNLQGLRIPLLESQPEFDIQVLSLVKVMLDSLNEKQIQSLLPTAQDRIVGSISKIEKWFETTGVQGFQNIIKFLRNLQELRSCGTGHRKGKGYAKISKEFMIEEHGYADAFVRILTQAVGFLDFIDENLATLVKPNT